METETLALYDHVRATTKGKLVVHGHSFGSFVAARLASKRPLDALLDQKLQAIDNRNALRAYQGPVLIINGVNDVQTPLVTARELFDNLNNPHKRFEAVAEAGHMTAMTKTDTLRAYRAFLDGAYN
ncbi:pimeloyl-ACP methyl ester carboxylesterase [Duganella sp. 1224]|uniref:alpha/beta hydrolase n=1 Tax=Duganella sp. 1224 TaxID=2587052 RepID=UPI0015CBAEB6|nr:hypothetical protein [Duganella sp. 1224]NYE61151.1 pimeloyl-ACP methyl ester carboxylesterase [Duganella sp. 1224]